MMARWAEPIHDQRLHLRRASRPLILDHAAPSRCEGIVEGALKRDSQSFGPFRNSECVTVRHTLEFLNGREKGCSRERRNGSQSNLVISF
jgi:hypothetical protein